MGSLMLSATGLARSQALVLGAPTTLVLIPTTSLIITLSLSETLFAGQRCVRPGSHVPQCWTVVLRMRWAVMLQCTANLVQNCKGVLHFSCRRFACDHAAQLGDRGADGDQADVRACALSYPAGHATVVMCSLCNSTRCSLRCACSGLGRHDSLQHMPDSYMHHIMIRSVTAPMLLTLPLQAMSSKTRTRGTSPASSRCTRSSACGTGSRRR